jgi:hypothetical protein
MSRTKEAPYDVSGRTVFITGAARYRRRDR